MTTAEYRKYLFPHDHPRLSEVRGLDCYAYRDAARRDDFTGGLIRGWTPLYLNDFVGVTESGELRADLHELTPARAGEEAPVAEMVAAARALMSLLDDGDRHRIMHPVDSVYWQTWANPEFMQFDTGVRLEFQSTTVKNAALDLMRVSLGDEGFAMAHRMMLINGFLGDVVGLPEVLNEFSYNIAIYGEPDETRPWGWHLFGHHCVVNVFVVDGRMVVSPAFLGAEPDLIDEGPHAGPGVFGPRIELSRALMASLTDAQRAAAIEYANLVDPAMPAGRVHPGDERHLAGAFQDNRIIPFQGICARDFAQPSRDLLLELVEEFCRLLPAGPRAAKMREVAEHLDETWVTWMGGYGDGEVFYLLVQSPVTVVELDHHCGVFLDYDTPQTFHIHTVMRTPHGNDYGRSWLRQWERAHAR